MKAFNYDMFERLELPQIILSTKYHKHLGDITNIDKNSINANFNLNSAQEVSFDVYKKMDGKECELWDKIIDLKYIFIPDYQEYYSISVSLDEDNKTIKHIVGTSACEYELAHRKLYNFECNTESDIERGEYVPTVLFNEDNPEASLLHRVLKDKCPDYKIGYVDPSIAKKQRVFSANDQDIYSFLTNDVATELECIFKFDSVNRVISVYNIKTYGENTGVYISPENYAELITVEGDVDNVFNCLKIEGGDELMTATVANINPNGSNYLYNWSEDMLNDMPEELVEKIAAYNELSAILQPTYEEYTQKIYELIDEELYLTSEMMPEVTTPETSASTEATNLTKQLKSVEVPNINSVSKASADSAVKGMAKVIVDPRYDINIDSSTLSSVSSNKRTWSGIITITNKGDEEDTATTSQFSVTIKSDDYEAYLYQKIQKALDRDDSVFYTIFEIEDMATFKTELKKYSLNRLTSFESSYQTCLDILIEQGVTTDTTELYGVNLYETMYKPYYNRIAAIQKEMVIRENEIKAVQDENAQYEKLRQDIQKQLNFKEYIGDDLWVIFSHYRIESIYKNDNYISEGLSNSELIRLASELFERGKEETIKASELQYSLSASLNNLLNTKEFKPFKDKINIGNWINLEADKKIYKLRLINLGINYGSLDKITVSFADVFRVKQLGVVEDTKAILEQAKNMANSYDYVAHQASQGSDANANVKDWLKEGLNSALVNIKNNNNEEVTYDKHGLWAKNYDDVTDSYSPEQLRITHNILCYTSDGWETVSLAIGKHSYGYYNESINDFASAIDFGVSAKFITAGFINGSQYIGGDIYSQNYSITNKTGTHIDLNDGTFTFAGGALKWDGTTLSISSPDIPTKVSQLTNDSGYQNKTQVTTITKDTVTTSYVNALNITAKKVSTDWVYAGNIKAGQIKTGSIVSTNGYTNINLDNGSFSFANGGLTYSASNGLSVSGKITSTSGNIAGWELSSKAFYKDRSVFDITNTTPGTYVGTDGIIQYASINSYTSIQGGVLTTNNADIKGKISANKFDIQGNTISVGIHSMTVFHKYYDYNTDSFESYMTDYGANYSFIFDSNSYVYSPKAVMDELVVTDKFHVKKMCAESIITQGLVIGIETIRYVFSGYTVTTGDGTSKQILTDDYLSTYYSDYDPDRTIVLIANGWGDKCTSHFNAATYLVSSKAWYATFAESIATSTTLQITYLVICL